MSHPDGHLPDKPVEPRRDEFDEAAYLERNPDVAAAVAAGTTASGWQHYTLHGRREGRPWPAQPNRLLGVTRTIAPDDEMFGGNEEHYFDVGESALRCIQRGLAAAGASPGSVRRILDLPCGHGRVLRFLRAAFPGAQLTACDLNREGVAFCARTFGAEPVVSETSPADVSLPGGYDLIWCGSLLTHLPLSACRDFLRLFRRALSARGVLVVTLHGRHYVELLSSGRRTCDLAPAQIEALLAEYRSAGFGYVDYQPGSGYGFSLTEASQARHLLFDDREWRLVDTHERGWDQRQDVFTLRRVGDVSSVISPVP